MPNHISALEKSPGRVEIWLVGGVRMIFISRKGKAFCVAEDRGILPAARRQAYATAKKELFSLPEPLPAPIPPKSFQQLPLFP
jgi:hypothetical protein